MPAKLIFYKSPETGEKTFKFCPLTEIGCTECPLPKRCTGEQDRHVAFNLRLISGHYKMTAIRSSLRR